MQIKTRYRMRRHKEGKSLSDFLAGCGLSIKLLRAICLESNRSNHTEALDRHILSGNASRLRFTALFTWDDSPQGHEYWNSVESEWLDYIAGSIITRNGNPDIIIPIYDYGDAEYRETEAGARAPKTIKEKQHSFDKNLI